KRLLKPSAHVTVENILAVKVNGLHCDQAVCWLLYSLIRCHASGENSAAGAFPSTMPSSKPTFSPSAVSRHSKRRCTPAGHAKKSKGANSIESLPSTPSHSISQRPLMLMKVSTVSWLCISTPVLGSHSMKDTPKPARICETAALASSPNGEV